MRKAKVVMVQGTGSGVGKSVITAALCRILLQDGWTVAPFKAQNMALNSYVTEDGSEIGMAQAVQAQACHIKPRAEMNPVLIKPTNDTGAQVIVMGKPVGNMSAKEYVSYKKRIKGVVKNSFEKLCSEYDAVVIEGAGSPAEINLKRHDIVNMAMAEYASAPVIIVGDIDRGGVFSWLVGTMELLTPRERRMVGGFIINKFRGDKSLLKSGIRFIENKTGKKVLGVIDYFKDIKIPEEDSLSLGSWALNGRASVVEDGKRIRIEVIALPTMSNFTDFDYLATEPDVHLRYVKRGEKIANPDVLIIPGTKNTISDLKYLYDTGYVRAIKDRVNAGVILAGICGGYQMLGRKIIDVKRVESNIRQIEGMGYIDMVTVFSPEKITRQVRVKERGSGLAVSGYEIHHGVPRGGAQKGRGRENFSEHFNIKNPVWGTYIHGIFDSSEFRRSFINHVRVKKGWQPVFPEESFNQDMEYDKLAGMVRDNIDIRYFYKLLNGRKHGRNI